MDWDQVRGCGNSTEFYDFLIRVLPPGASVLEMGVFYGRGLVYLAKHSKFIVHGVDQFIWSAMPYHLDSVRTDQDFHEACVRNLKECGVSDKVNLIHATSQEASKLFPDHSLDCVYLDGDHSDDAVAYDIEFWKPKVKPGGILAGDDYIEPWRGVIKAVDAVFPNRSLMGQVWWTQL